MKKLIFAILAVIAGQTAFTMQGPSQAPRSYNPSRRNSNPHCRGPRPLCTCIRTTRIKMNEKPKSPSVAVTTFNKELEKITITGKNPGVSMRKTEKIAFKTIGFVPCEKNKPKIN
ncbi:hypothetical protein KAU11_06010 [Candidatus Babeliales bacterium]|nr:hypothetical protein [Candidatus Babeliales bacterium]